MSTMSSPVTRIKEGLKKMYLGSSFQYSTQFGDEFKGYLVQDSKGELKVEFTDALVPDFPNMMIAERVPNPRAMFRLGDPSRKRSIIYEHEIIPMEDEPSLVGAYCWETKNPAGIKTLDFPKWFDQISNAKEFDLVYFPIDLGPEHFAPWSPGSYKNYVEDRDAFVRKFSGLRGAHVIFDEMLEEVIRGVVSEGTAAQNNDDESPDYGNGHVMALIERLLERSLDIAEVREEQRRTGQMVTPVEVLRENMGEDLGGIEGTEGPEPTEKSETVNDMEHVWSEAKQLEEIENLCITVEDLVQHTLELNEPPREGAGQSRRSKKRIIKRHLKKR